jgi:hypothetical protein
MGPTEKLIHSIRNRSLWQVVGLYAAGAWVALQVVDVLADAFDLPGRFAAIALTLLIIGFPMVLATALVQQRLRRTGDGTEQASPTPPDEGADEGQKGAWRLLTWRNVIGTGVAAFAVWGVVVTVWLLTQGGPGRNGADATAALPLSRSVIAVLPFSVRGSSELDYLGEGMVSLLGTKLDGAGELRNVDARALLSFVGQEGTAADPESAAEIARRFGAGRFVMGDVVEAGGRLQLSASLYGTDEWSEPIVEAAAEGEDAFALVDEIATGLLAGVEGGPGARVRRIAAVTTTSLPAFRAYLEGEAAFRSGHFQPALEERGCRVAHPGRNRALVSGAGLPKREPSVGTGPEAAGGVSRLAPRRPWRSGASLPRHRRDLSDRCGGLVPAGGDPFPLEPPPRSLGPRVDDGLRAGAVVRAERRSLDHPSDPTGGG